MHYAGWNKISAGYYEIEKYPKKREDFISHTLNENYLCYDSEPDIFSFSLWNGSGKFVFNHDSTLTKNDVIFTNPSNCWKVKVLTFKEQNDTIHYFELTDNAGNIYEFKKYEQTSSYGGEDSGTIYDMGPQGCSSRYNSSWFLTKVISASSRDTIKITYADENYYSPVQGSCYKATYIPQSTENIQWNYLSFPKKGRDIDSMSVTYSNEPIATQYVGTSSASDPLTKNPYRTWSRTENKTARIQEISWSNGTKIHFFTSNRNDVFYRTGYNPTTNDNEDDFHMQKLDSIVVTNSQGETVNKYSFGYSYFGNNNDNDTESYLIKRLRLDNITDGLNPSNKYQFTYYGSDVAFPTKQSNSVDYWGYYNGMDYGQDYYCSTYRFGNPYTPAYEGADKMSDLNCTLLGQLKTIKYPTGSEEQFSYKLNNFKTYTQEKVTDYNLKSFQIESTGGDYYSNLKSSSIMTLNTTKTLRFHGELHVTSRNSSGSVNPDGVDLYYNNDDSLLVIKQGNNIIGNVVRWPNDKYGNSEDIIIDFPVELEAGTYTIISPKLKKGWYCKWTLDSRCYTTLVGREISMDGAGLRIDSIVEGEKLRTFSYNGGKLIVTPLFGYKKLFYGNDYSGNHATFFIQTSQSNRPVSSMANGYNLGYSEVIEKVDSIETKYSFFLKPYQEMSFSSDPMQMMAPAFENGLLQRKSIQKISDTYPKYFEETIYTDKKATILDAFALGSRGNIYDFGYYGITWWYPMMKTISSDITIINNYTYNDNLMIKSVTTSSDSQSTISSITYSTEGSEEINDKMRERNIIVPIETEKTINGTTASKAKMAYYHDTSSDMILPQTLYTFDLDGKNFKEHITYEKYDTTGNILQITKDGIPITYIWGYNNQYPIAELTNCTYDMLPEYIKTLSSKPNPENQDWTNIRNLNQNDIFKKVLIRTFTYKPLVGITSETSANGYTIFYRYDTSGRLIRKEDADGNTLQTFEYNYHQEQE